MPTGTPMRAEWIQWIAENRSLGVPEGEISSILVANGVDALLTEQKSIEACSASGLPRLEKMRALMDIYSRLWRCWGPVEVPQISGLTSDAFFRWYYSMNRPVVLLGDMENWPALKVWSLDYLRDICGDAIVEVMTDRSADPQYEINCERHKTNMRFGDYVDLVQAAGPTNDFYMVANNHSLEYGEMRRLLHDIRPIDGIIDPGRSSRTLFFWFGPSGTVTPLHHDTMNVLLAQVLGRKKVTLIPSFQTPLVYNHIGVYSDVDCESPDYDRFPLFKDTTRLEVLLEPGQALFIPVGWWHHVRSLDVSISVSFTNFRASNDYAWGNSD